MKHIFLTVIALIVLAGCNQYIDKSGENNSNSPAHENALKSNVSTDTTGFLGNCKKLLKHRSVGYLQGTTISKDSTGLFGFFDSYDSPLTYEIIFVAKGGIKSRSLDSISSVDEKLDKGCDNNFSDFDCYAFVYPMRDPEKQDDMHAMNIDFPVNVKAYIKVEGDNWRLVKQIKTNSFKEFSKFQFDVIYSEIN